jgi:hypothetical protein
MMKSAKFVLLCYATALLFVLGPAAVVLGDDLDSGESETTADAAAIERGTCKLLKVQTSSCREML